MGCAVSHNIFDGKYRHIVLLPKANNLGEAGHSAVFVGQFAEHRGLSQACNTYNVDTALGVPSTLQNAILTSTKGEYMPRMNEVFGASTGASSCLNRAETVPCRDSRSNALSCLYGDGKSGLIFAGVVLHHGLELQLLALLILHTYANNTAALAYHEGNIFLC